MPQYKSNKATKDGRCWFFKVQYRDSLNNLKVFISKKYATKTEARDEERKYINLINDENRAPTEMTIGDLWNKFIDFQRDKVKLTTFRGYMHTQKYIEPLFKIKCVDLSPAHYQEWRKKMNAVKTLNNVSKNDKLKVLRTVLNFGVKQYDFNFNKFKNQITKFSDPNEVLKPEHNVYSPDDFNQFLNGEDELVFRCLWETLYYNGLRIGEARGLTWNDIDFTNKTMSINKQIQNIDNCSANYYVTGLKTPTSYRTLPISDALLQDLKDYHDSVSAYRNYSDEFYCFGEFGGIIPLSYQKARRRKRRIAKETGVREIRLHDFRHSCASLLINSGATITLVSKYMGHSNVTETLNTYSHLFKSDLQNISSLLDKIQKDA